MCSAAGDAIEQDGEVSEGQTSLFETLIRQDRSSREQLGYCLDVFGQRLASHVTGRESSECSECSKCSK